jgi:hypothetical protein
MVLTVFQKVLKVLDCALPDLFVGRIRLENGKTVFSEDLWVSIRAVKMSSQPGVLMTNVGLILLTYPPAFLPSKL